MLAPYSGITINSARRLLRRSFEDADLPDAVTEARLLLEFITGLDAAGLIAQGTEFLPPEQFAQVGALCERRLYGEPVDHILGTRDFYGRAFEISGDVLSPRQETEQIIDIALSLPWQTFCDIGTGSGAIAITLACEREAATGLATDTSAPALKVARANGSLHGVRDRVKFSEADWLPDMTPQDRVDLLVSNPPYIASGVMAGLQREVRHFDPALALDGGQDGLSAYRAILARLPDVLLPGGYCVFEIGYDQGESVRDLCRAAGLQAVRAEKDLAGLDRIVWGQYR